MMIYFLRSGGLHLVGQPKMDYIVRSRKAKMRIVRKVHDGNILPVTTYGCESWALNNAMRSLRLHSENWNA